MEIKTATQVLWALLTNVYQDGNFARTFYDVTCMSTIIEDVALLILIHGNFNHEEIFPKL